MKNLRVIAAALAVALSTAASSAASPPRETYAIVIWRVSAPQASDPNVASIEAGLVGLNFIAPLLASLSHYPGAKATLALDPAFVTSLERAASNATMPQDLARKISSSGLTSTELLDALGRTVTPTGGQSDSRAASRLLRYASESGLVIAGRTRTRLTGAAMADYVGSATLLSLSAGGYLKGAAAQLLSKDSLGDKDLSEISAAFQRACADLLERLRHGASDGMIELAALPAYEPIMPLVIDAAGRTDRVPFTVNLNASADVAEAADEGMKAVRTLDPAPVGLVSPAGAYDDDAAMLIQARHASYAVFSERVIKRNVGAAAQSVADARAAAFQPYLLETSKTSNLPIFFCSDTASNSIAAQTPSAPSQAMAERLEVVMRSTLVAAPSEKPPVAVLCLPAAAILQRPDREAALDDFSAALSGGEIRASTPRHFLSDHPPTAATYGYDAASDVGGFGLWMGSQPQMTLWSALADARKAAGGDSALSNAGVRDALLRAESGRWFMVPSLPQPKYVSEYQLSQFRSLLAQIYRAAGSRVPANIAPIKLEGFEPATQTAAHP